MMPLAVRARLILRNDRARRISTKSARDTARKCRCATSRTSRPATKPVYAAGRQWSATCMPCREVTGLHAAATGLDNRRVRSTRNAYTAQHVISQTRTQRRIRTIRWAVCFPAGRVEMERVVVYNLLRRRSATPAIGPAADGQPSPLDDPAGSFGGDLQSMNRTAFIARFIHRPLQIFTRSQAARRVARTARPSTADLPLHDMTMACTLAPSVKASPMTCRQRA
jgi:hypothetical protein